MLWIPGVRVCCLGTTAVSVFCRSLGPQPKRGVFLTEAANSRLQQDSPASSRRTHERRCCPWPAVLRILRFQARAFLQLQVAGPRTQPEWCPSYLSGDDSPGNYFGDCDTQAVSPQYIFLRLSKLVRNVPFLGFKSPLATRPSPPHVPARGCSSLSSSTSPPGWSPQSRGTLSESFDREAGISAHSSGRRAGD